MDKESFFNMFVNQDQTSLYSVFNDVISAETSNYPVISKDFLTPDIWGTILDCKDKLGINAKAYGVFEEAERRVLIFNSKENYGLNLVKVENNNKFISLSHRDYLGGVLSLGIKREKLGDFILKDNICYFPCKEEISDYLSDNIKVIGNTKVNVSLIDKEAVSLVNVDYDDMVIEVPSLRLDSIVSEITKSSRSEGVNLIRRGLVLYNYSEAEDKSRIISLNSVITVRGYGKYKIADEIGKTKKGNLKIYIKKYK
ncbi:MAG: YlmH/Sll1252 family protein [Bacillota bacterium]|nr:YlmH/Sll1252 family protein [Bacillota bacterium]